MKKGVYLVEINKLRPHEKTDGQRLECLISQLLKDGCLKNPVVVENNHFIILDGHHRVAALKKLGAEKIPVYLVNYQDKNIRVYLRRKELLQSLIKGTVVKRVKEGRLLPSKTTRHLIKNRPKSLNIPLGKLRFGS